jgi:plastocyanin
MGTRSILPAFAFLGVLAGTLPAQSSRGILRGTVFARGIDGPVKLAVTRDQEWCGDSVPNRHLQMANGRVANALVVLEYRGETDFGATSVTIEGTNCDFRPTVQVAAPGATLVARNTDPVAHTMLVKQDGLDLGVMQVQSRTEKKQKDLFATPGLVEIHCQYHDWMSANIWVLEHPYYAVTARDGSFSIALIPPGTYRLTVWHEQLGVLEKDIVIAGNTTSTANFTYERE